MQIKVFEVRDRGTFIPILVIRMVSTEDSEKYLLARSGYDSKAPLCLVVHLSSNRAQYAPMTWDGRTMPNAHRYIEKNWDNLASGEVIDIEFILGETLEKKQSERYG